MELSTKINIAIQLAVAIPAILKVLHTMFTSDSIYEDESTTLIAQITDVVESIIDGVKNSKGIKA